MIFILCMLLIPQVSMDNSVREITEQLCRETGEIECTNTCYIQPQSPFDMIPTGRLHAVILRNLPAASQACAITYL